MHRFTLTPPARLQEAVVRACACTCACVSKYKGLDLPTLIPDTTLLSHPARPNSVHALRGISSHTCSFRAELVRVCRHIQSLFLLYQSDGHSMHPSILTVLYKVQIRLFRGRRLHQKRETTKPHSRTSKTNEKRIGKKNNDKERRSDEQGLVFVVKQKNAQNIVVTKLITKTCFWYFMRVSKTKTWRNHCPGEKSGWPGQFSQVAFVSALRPNIFCTMRGNVMCAALLY